MSYENECTGQGICHGCLKWCSDCGDVSHICDMRLRGNNCDQHPFPLTNTELRKNRLEAECILLKSKILLSKGKKLLEQVEEDEKARRIYNLQLDEEQNKLFNFNTKNS